MTGEIQIQDVGKYTTSMSKSMIDKMFFMDKIDSSIKVIFDYGCADGALINFLAPLFPDIAFVGYDASAEMIEHAISNKTYKNVSFIDNLDNFSTWLSENNFTSNQCAINLSSLIHEVYSYSSIQEIEEFWNFVNKSGFEYIIIRDMCLDAAAHRPALKEDLIKVRSRYAADKIREFENIHGSICDNYNLIHFLLKYRYTENWNREVHENYLPLAVEDIAGKIDTHYELIYFDHYILPFLANIVQVDFDITIKDYTHIKFIYRQKGNR